MREQMPPAAIRSTKTLNKAATRHVRRGSFGFADDLALLPLQARSQKSYWACLRQLSEHYNRSPEIVTPEQLRQYLAVGQAKWL
jgi:hypothetical protein